MIDHDELFKELLTTFFFQFIAAFLPDMMPHLDLDYVEFLDKEMLRGVGGRTSRKKHHADLVAKVRYKGQEVFFLTHIENQAKSETDFAKRMFRYFARLSEKFDLPVYPIAVLSYDTPKRRETNRYTVNFWGGTVLSFQYKAIQLNRLSWKNFIKTPNPASAALLAKMNVAPRDRAKVAAEMTRMILTLKLEPGKAQLIFGFMENYLNLTGAQLKQYEEELEELTPEERDATMGIWTQVGRENYTRGKLEGKQEGIEEGELKGKVKLIAGLINRRFGPPSSIAAQRLSGISADALDELGFALFDMESMTALEDWLAEQTRQ